MYSSYQNSPTSDGKHEYCHGPPGKRASNLHADELSSICTSQPREHPDTPWPLFHAMLLVDG